MAIGIADVHECIGNPLKLRIVMLLSRNGPMTAKQMLRETEAPQTTLYRTVNGMVESGILEVVSETRVRAVTERTYGLSIDFNHFDVDAIRGNDLDGYCSMFSAFSLGLIRDFEEYARDPDADLNRDSTGFASVGLYLTDEQAREVSWRIAEVIEPYMVRGSPEQRLHTMAFVLTPPQRRESVAESSAGTLPMRPKGDGE